MRFGRSAALCCVAVLCFHPAVSSADPITVYYGDDDGFGFPTPITSGALSENPASTNNSTASDPPLTDRNLIGGPFDQPGFTPTDGFNTFTLAPDESIVSATLVARFGAFDPEPSLIGTNRLRLDNTTVAGFFLPVS
jgi:hypothetical protein